MVIVDDLVQSGGTLIECHALLSSLGAKHGEGGGGGRGREGGHGGRGAKHGERGSWGGSGVSKCGGTEGLQGMVMENWLSKTLGDGGNPPAVPAGTPAHVLPAVLCA